MSKNDFKKVEIVWNFGYTFDTTHKNGCTIPWLELTRALDSHVGISTLTLQEYKYEWTQWRMLVEILVLF